jgi:membrane dipeptidase
MGLTRLGRDVVSAINACGIIIGLGLDTEFHSEDDLPAGVNANDWWPAEYYGQMAGHSQLQPEMLDTVAKELSLMGYGTSDINAIFGDNFMRIAEATWPGEPR